MWFVKACRGCLTTEGNLENIDQATARAFSIVAGIEIKVSDGYPSCLCFECKARIKTALLFRRKVKRAHYVLQEVMHVKKQITLKDVQLIDRQKTNLKSTLCVKNGSVDDIAPSFTERDTIMCENEITKLSNEIKQDVKPIQENSDGITKDSDNCDDDIDVTGTYIDDTDNKIEDYTDIDLNDVFKGLKEPCETELDSRDEEEKEENGKCISKTIKSKLKSQGVVKKKIREYISSLPENIKKEAQVLARTELRYLDLNEQKEVYKQRLGTEEFTKALFKCALCVKTFADMEQVTAHCDYHIKKKDYKHPCTVCKNKFRTETVLNRHLMNKHWYEFTCTKCHKRHWTLGELKQCYQYVSSDYFNTDKPLAHMKRSLVPPSRMYELTAQTGSFHCTECQVQFNTKKSLEKHNYFYHEYRMEGCYCDICKMRFANRLCIETHMQKTHIYKYTCKSCKKSLYNLRSALSHSRQCKEILITGGGHCYICNKYVSSLLELHMQMNHGVPCNICGESAIGAEGLYMHQLHKHGHVRLNTVAELNDPRFYCLHCEIYFCDEPAYFRHLCRRHFAEAKLFESGCVLCQQLFSNPKELQEHECPVNKVPIGCVLCQQLFSNPKELQEHECPVNKVPFYNYKQCVHCKKIMRSLQEYFDHCIEMHPGLPTELATDTSLCDICGKVYSSQSVRSHFRKCHKSQDRVICKFCDYENTPSVLVHHILATHTYRPYLCLKCPKRFEFKYACRKHLLKIHSPVLPYSCEACSLPFAHLDFLNAHCVKVHGIDLKKTDPSVFLNHKMLDKIYVYPDMKIDGSLIPIEYLIETEVYRCDYMEESKQPIDINECFFFDSNVRPDVPTKPLSAEKRKTKCEKEKYKRIRNMMEAYIKDNDVEALARLVQRHDLRYIKPNLYTQNDNDQRADETTKAIKTIKKIMRKGEKQFKTFKTRCKINEKNKCEDIFESKAHTDEIENIPSVDEYAEVPDCRLDMPDLSDYIVSEVSEAIDTIDEKYLAGAIDTVNEITDSEQLDQTTVEHNMEQAQIVDETIVDETVVDEMIVDETVVDQTVQDEIVVDQTVQDDIFVDQTVVDEMIVDQGVVNEIIVDEGVVAEMGKNYVLHNGCLYMYEG